MELNNEFEVERSLEETWAVLTDVERIAPCLPGAQLEEIEGDEYRGRVKIKVGPITAQYKGKAHFVEKDDAAHKAVLKAEGRDPRQGNASALITAKLTDVGSNKTKVAVSTDLTVTGKVAQFGRGVMADVSEKLLNQFVANLETKVLAEPSGSEAEVASTLSGGAVPASAPAAAPTDTTGSAASGTASRVGSGEAGDNGAAGAQAPAQASTVRKITPVEPVQPVDLLGATGAPLLKRLGPLVGGLFVLVVLTRWLRRRRG